MNSNYQILIEIHRKGGGRPQFLQWENALYWDFLLDHSTHGGFSELAIFDAMDCGPKSKSTEPLNQAWTYFIHVYMYVIACERMQVCVCVCHIPTCIYIYIYDHLCIHICEACVGFSNPNHLCWHGPTNIWEPPCQAMRNTKEWPRNAALTDRFSRRGR